MLILKNKRYCFIVWANLNNSGKLIKQIAKYLFEFRQTFAQLNIKVSDIWTNNIHYLAVYLCKLKSVIDKHYLSSQFWTKTQTSTESNEIRIDTTKKKTHPPVTFPQPSSATVQFHKWAELRRICMHQQNFLSSIRIRFKV